MTIKQVYSEFIKELKSLHNEGEAVAITNILFEHFAKLTSSVIVINGEIEMEIQVLIKLRESLIKLKENIPVQYITGHAWFYNLIFEVNNSVLIPRSETEELVLEAINFLKENEGKKVLDIGTGSGCIPISIKKNIANALVTSIDVSRAAISVAKNNAAKNNVEINFLQLDFLDERNYKDLAEFDLIISNPPYIPENEKANLNKNVVDFEPHLALFVPDNDHLIFYRKIVVFAENHLQKNGKILLEIHEDFADETAALFLAEKYIVEIKKDMQGKERMLLIYRCL